MHRLLAIAALATAAMLTVPGTASGAPPTIDSAVGQQEFDFENTVQGFDLHAFSGPKGENPIGALFREEGLDTRHDFRVTCLAVSGNTAIIGLEGRTLFRIGSFALATGLAKVVDAGGPGALLDTFDVALRYTLPSVPGPTTCASFPGPFGPSVGHVPVVSDLVVRDDGPAPPRKRMVGKGSLTGGIGGTAAYAYIVDCEPTFNPDAPFEVRFGTQRFRLTRTSSSVCVNVGSATTQSGSGTGTLTSGGPGTIEWSFSDGGPGGANDQARITIKNAADTIVFGGSAAPPGKFPGSTQTTGVNTYQNVPSAY